MIEQLYEPFKNWAKKGSVWLYSDTHFDDEDCLLMDKNWPTPEEQVKLINKYACKNDTLILLGDVGNIEYVKQLKAGHKVLICGNHDKGVSNYKRKSEFIRSYKTIEETELAMDNREIDHYELTPRFKILGYKDNRLFDEVYSGPLFIGEKLLLSHEPIDLPFALNIHGHCHSGICGYYGKLDGSFYFNVCSNIIGYKPISLGEIIKHGCLSKIENIHRQTIEKAKEGIHLY